MRRRTVALTMARRALSTYLHPAAGKARKDGLNVMWRLDSWRRSPRWLVGGPDTRGDRVVSELQHKPIKLEEREERAEVRCTITTVVIFMSIYMVAIIGSLRPSGFLMHELTGGLGRMLAHIADHVLLPLVEHGRAPLHGWIAVPKP